MIRILIKDKIEPFVIDELKQRGFIIQESTETSGSLLQEVKENEILIVRSETMVTREVIDSAMQTGILKLIIRAGVGLDNIDVDYAQSQGIRVANTPEASSAAVAELALAHMFALARKIIPANLAMRGKKWNKKQCQGIELSGKILGIIGMGRIGKCLAQKASALGMQVVYSDIISEQQVDSSWKHVSKDELLFQSDFVSLHVPAIQDGSYLIGESELGKMKKGAFLINTSRGNLVNEQALLEALEQRKIAGAGIDVYCQEPCDNHALSQQENISVTPHIGASTLEAQSRIGQVILNIIKEYDNQKRFHKEQESGRY